MRKVLVANRGEIACRVIQSCHRLGLETVAVYSEADAGALHADMASEAFPVGPPAARDSYLRPEKILEVARTSGADAVHPGYGFLAENARFAEHVQEAGMVWIGPRPETIDAMGDKERAREIARAAGVSTLPGSARFVPGKLDGVQQAAEEVGYPLLVKASAGGGGIGMRRVDQPGDLVQIAEATQGMAAKAFGDGAIYLERFVPKARHIEVQVFGFGDGRAVHLYERDCSVQRRFQKIVEESPAPNLPAEVRASINAAALELCKHQRYAGAGTVEFIVDASSFEFFFLEMNTRIQVEHPVTEMVTGLDIVGLQLDLARGALEPFLQESVSTEGHAIECRLYAERPEKNFLPSPGHLETFSMPHGMSKVRIDTGLREGDTITPHYDPMIAKIICRGETRAQAIEQMLQALEQTEVAGIRTNLAFLMRIMEDARFRAGDVATDYIQERGELLLPSKVKHPA